MAKLEVTNSVFAANYIQNGLKSETKPGDHVWTNGYIGTPDGYVSVTALKSLGEHCYKDHTTMYYRRNGKDYRRSWNRFYSHKFIVTLAKEFAAECASSCCVICNE